MRPYYVHLITSLPVFVLAEVHELLLIAQWIGKFYPDPEGWL